MKQGIHPEFQEVVFMDSATGAKFLAGSTLKPSETIDYEGETYPLVRVVIRFTPILHWQAKVCSSRWSNRKVQQEVRLEEVSLLSGGSSPIGAAFFVRDYLAECMKDSIMFSV